MTETNLFSLRVTPLLRRSPFTQYSPDVSITSPPPDLKHLSTADWIFIVSSPPGTTIIGEAWRNATENIASDNDIRYFSFM